MRWYVDITSIASHAAPLRLCVEGSHWQAALQRARALRGEPERLAGLSVDFLEDGCRVFDAVLRERYMVKRASDDALLSEPPENAPGSPASVPGSKRPPPPVRDAAAPGTDEEPPPLPPAARSQPPAVGSHPRAATSQPRAATSQPSTSRSEPLASPAAVEQRAGRSRPKTMAFASEGAVRTAEPEPSAASRKRVKTVAFGSVGQAESTDAHVRAAERAPVSTGGQALLEETLPSAGSELVYELLSARQVEPTADSPLTYREYVYGLSGPLPSDKLDRFIRDRLGEVREALQGVASGKVVNIALFDHIFHGRPERPPIVTLSWKDWRGDEPEISFAPYRAHGSKVRGAAANAARASGRPSALSGDAPPLSRPPRPSGRPPIPNVPPDPTSPQGSSSPASRPGPFSTPPAAPSPSQPRPVSQPPAALSPSRPVSQPPAAASPSRPISQPPAPAAGTPASLPPPAVSQQRPFSQPPIPAAGRPASIPPPPRTPQFEPHRDAPIPLDKAGPSLSSGLEPAPPSHPRPLPPPRSSSRPPAGPDSRPSPRSVPPAEPEQQPERFSQPPVPLTRAVATPPSRPRSVPPSRPRSVPPSRPSAPPLALSPRASQPPVPSEGPTAPLPPVQAEPSTMPSRSPATWAEVPPSRRRSRRQITGKRPGPGELEFSPAPAIVPERASDSAVAAATPVPAPRFEPAVAAPPATPSTPPHAVLPSVADSLAALPPFTAAPPPTPQAGPAPFAAAPAPTPQAAPAPSAAVPAAIPEAAIPAVVVPAAPAAPLLTPEERARAMAPRPSSPTGPRLEGDDLLTDLFEAMAELHFLGDALEGADFVLAQAMEKLPCEVGLVSLFDMAKREYVVVRQAGGKRSGLLRRLPQHAKLPQMAMRYSRAVIVADASRYRDQADSRWREIGVPTRSLLCAPIELDGRYLGLIELCNPHDGQAFRESDGHALTYIGRQYAEFVANRGVVTEAERVLEGLEPGVQ